MDVILQELDNIEESPKATQKQTSGHSPPLMDLIKLKSPQIHHEDQDHEILEDIFKEIEENQEEEFRKNNPQLFERAENEELDDEEQDGNDFLDDSDFIEKSNRMDRDQQNLAQHIFEQNYKKQKQFQRKRTLVKKKTLLYQKPLNQKGKMHFINRQTQLQKKEKELLHEREKQMLKENMTFGGEDQKKQMNIMQELIQQDNNANVEEEIEEHLQIPDHKKKKKGELIHYKLVLNDFVEYQSHSHSDVLEIQQKAKIKYKL